MELINIGDCLPFEGEYKLHSAFNSVVNFQNGILLLSVVNESIGGGPVNIVVKNADFSKIETLKISRDYIFINNLLFNKNLFKIYNSTLFFSLVNKVELKNIINYVIRELLIYSHEKSLTFLFDNERSKYFKTGFDKAFHDTIKTAVSEIYNNNNMYNGIKMMKGSGTGLTPSGDDFITGLLAALYIYENITGISSLKKRQKIYEIAKGENYISNTFLYYAAKGFFFERFKNFVISLFLLDEKEISINTKLVLSIGNTSGADIITGFLMTLNKLLSK